MAVRESHPARVLHEALARLEGSDFGASTHLFAETLLANAVRQGASDIHLDPIRDGYQLKLRIDGVLVGVLALPLEAGLHLVRFFKTRADLDSTLTLRPQDGRAALLIDGAEVFVRVATGPGVRGEKLALRLLPHAPALPQLDQLGLDPRDHEALLRALHDVCGMVLISGPTGSGKTTTLYAVLRELSHIGRSIVSIEDPVEYVLDGVTQLQVNERQGLTYAEGVRALLRLDPDVLVLGEMRDALSARAALDAADSGHVFLSSLHARDAAGTLGVMRHFGLSNHEIAASVDLLVAQRLIRRLCRECRRWEAPSAEEAQWLKLCGWPLPDKTWRAAGCPQCSGSGYRGRVGIFEIHRMREEDADLILANADEHTLRRHLRGSGTLSMLEDAQRKVAEGITSIAEIQQLGGVGFFARMPERLRGGSPAAE